MKKRPTPTIINPNENILIFLPSLAINKYPPIKTINMDIIDRMENNIICSIVNIILSPLLF